jgi:hypothetical protein
MRFRCYLIAACSVKISILLFYRRLSSNFNRAFFIATWIGIAYNIAYLVTFLIVIGSACRPLKAYWWQLNPEWAATHKFTCIDAHITLPTSAGMSILGDCYATLLPCILILKLDLPRRQKLALYPLFLLGFLVVVAGIARTYFINYVINETYDITWYLWKYWIWTLVELYSAIMAASAPALKPFFLRFLVDRITSRRGGSSIHARDHKTDSRRDREAQHKLWSNTRSTMALGEGGDVEKIGMAVAGDGTRKYELRTLPSGKVEPVLVDAGPRKSLDLQSDSPASSLYHSEHSEWALPTIGLSDDSSPLRADRAGIDTLPPFPGPRRPAPAVEYATGSRSVTPSHQMRSRSLQRHSTSIPRYSSLPNVRGGSERDRSPDLTHRSSRASVKLGRLPAESVRKSDAEAGAAQRVVAPRASNVPDGSDVDYVGSEASTSDETLQLPKQGRWDGDSSVYDDDKSLRLPRQGVSDFDVFRASKVGLAV